MLTAGHILSWDRGDRRSRSPCAWPTWFPPAAVRKGDAALHNRVRFGHLVRFEADGEYVVAFSGARDTESRHRKDPGWIPRTSTATTPKKPQRIPDGKGVYSFTVKARKGVREVGIKSFRFGEGPVFVKEFT